MSTNHKIFNPDIDNIEDALEYMKNRSFQLLKFSIFPTNIQITNFGVIVDYTNTQGIEYIGAYIIKRYRGKHLLKSIIKNSNKTFINLFETGLMNYLMKESIRHTTVGFCHKEQEYIGIQEYSRDSSTDVGILDINKVEEALAILDWIGADSISKKAVCLIPKLYNDSDFLLNWRHIPQSIDNKVILFAMEFRNIASRYDIGKKIKTTDDIEVSEIAEVNNIIRATAIRRYNHFELYIKNQHPRSGLIEEHYKNLLKRLGCEETYPVFRDRLSTINIFNDVKKDKRVVA